MSVRYTRGKGQPGKIANYFAEDFNLVSRGMAPEVFDVGMSVEAATRQGELEMKLGASAVRSEYQKRVADISQLRSRAQQALGSLETERVAMQHAKDEIIVMMRDFQSTLEVNLSWLKLRRGGHSHTASAAMTEHNKNIELSIEQSAKDIKNALLNLATELAKLTNALKEIDEAIAKLKDDIVTKSANIVLDKACMDGLLAMQSPTASQQGTSSSANPPSPRSQQQQGKSSARTNETDWIGKGQLVIVQGLHVLERCAPVRKSATIVVSEIREAGRLQRNPQVLDAFRLQQKCGEQLDHQLDLNKKAMVGQQQQLAKQRASLLVSLGKTREQLSIAMQRMQMSSLRPVLEGAPSNVEEVLHLEIAKLQRNAKEIEEKLKVVESSFKKAEMLVGSLEKQAEVNNKTVQLVKECLDVKLPPISSPRAPTDATPRRVR